MSIDPELLAAIEQAVDEAPDNMSLRLHLAGLLVQAEQPNAALGHAQIVLAAQPASIEALTIAHDAAVATGADESALGYQRLLAALGAGPTITNEPIPPGPGAAPLPTARPDTIPNDAGALASMSLGDPADLVTDPDVERPRITLADVAGMEAVKRRIDMSFLAPARDPALRQAFRKSLRGGLLLYGPPGCGKTYIARALAGELNTSFLSIGVADILDSWVGSSERNLHDLFEMARRHTPCVLFLDEIDALGQRRSHLRNAPSMRSTVNQLLIELDGVDVDNEGLFILGASNQPWDIDPALRRPGRFDRMVFVGPPDLPARAAILAANLRNRPLAARFDVAAAAKTTEGWSGADLVLLCDTATEFAMERSMATGEIDPITTADLDRARASNRPSTAAWMDAAENVATYANQGGDYDELAEHLTARRRR